MCFGVSGEAPPVVALIPSAPPPWNHVFLPLQWWWLTSLSKPGDGRPLRSAPRALSVVCCVMIGLSLTCGRVSLCVYCVLDFVYILTPCLTWWQGAALVGKILGLLFFLHIAVIIKEV